MNLRIICLLLFSTLLVLVTSAEGFADLSGDAFERKSDKKFLAVGLSKEGCADCKDFRENLAQVAGKLQGLIKVRTATDASLVKEHGAQDAPVLKVFYKDEQGKRISSTYKGYKSVDKMTEWIVTQFQEALKKRVGKLAEKPKRSASSSNSEADVIEMDGKDFDRIVMQDTENVWFIELYAPWCGHCQSFAPKWKEAGRALRGKVKVAAINGDANKDMMQRFQARGFPTLKLLPAGPKSESKAVDYTGPRETAAVVAFALGHVKTEVQQLLDNEMFESECETGVCVLAFLPHILDSKASGRRDYIQTLNKLAQSFGDLPVKVFWLEGGENFELEERLRLQFGFPAYIAVKLDKGKYAIHKGSSSLESLRSFITALTTGRSLVEPLPSNIRFKKMTKWDGKDGAAHSDEF